jgi:hypothetical protein
MSEHGYPDLTNDTSKSDTAYKIRYKPPQTIVYLCISLFQQDSLHYTVFVNEEEANPHFSPGRCVPK